MIKYPEEIRMQAVEGRLRRFEKPTRRSGQTRTIDEHTQRWILQLEKKLYGPHREAELNFIKGIVKERDHADETTIFMRFKLREAQ